MSRKGENIRKRNDGRWEGRFIYQRDVNGSAKYRSIYGRSYTEVKRRMEVEKRKNDTEAPTTCGYKITFGKAAERWIVKNELRLKRSTVIKYSEQLNKHILPIFSEIELASISEPTVAKFMKRKSSELSGSSLRTLLTIIKSILKYGARQGWCGEVYIDLSVPSASSRCSDALENEERCRLEAFLTEKMDLVKLGLYLCLFTGLRVGELCALRWSDIDLDKSTLSVSFTLQRLRKESPTHAERTEIVLTEPKSSSSKRMIPLPSQLISFIAPFKAHDSCFLLTGTQSPMEPRTIQYRFKKYAQKLGLSKSNMHVLRHTFATHCIELGFDAKTLSEILGHSRVDITLNRYVHSSDERKRNQMMLLYKNDGQNYGHI